jgi:hypothetical protein
VSLSIDACNPRVDREFGAEFCRLWGINPNQVVEMTYYYDPSSREGIVEFWGHHWDGYWLDEVDAPPVQPRLLADPGSRVLLHRVRYAIEFEPVPMEFKR